MFFSNAGFALVGLLGLLRLWPQQRHAALASSSPGYRLFLWALVLTAAGSGFYHLAPDNARLVWDRLPIALACAGLLTEVHAETALQGNRPYVLPLLATAAAAMIVRRLVCRTHAFVTSCRTGDKKRAVF